MAERWHAHGVKRNYNNERPVVGDVVALYHRAWEVTHVSDAIPTPEEEERLNSYTAAFRDKQRPYSVSLRRLHGARHDRENDRAEVGFRIRVGARDVLPVYPNGRVPLCSCHSHPWPCLESEQQAWAEKEMKSAEKVLNLLPGCCPACAEPITSRQKSITFGGPNVRNPLAEGPTYHLRGKCYSGAARYEEKWVAAEPGRPRSLLTLQCEGTLVVHGDGSAECHGGTDPDCPSVYARHRCYCACYIERRGGCARGCTPTGHPGTRVAGRPTDPRAVSHMTPT